MQWPGVDPPLWRKVFHSRAIEALRGGEEAEGEEEALVTFVNMTELLYFECSGEKKKTISGLFSCNYYL